MGVLDEIMNTPDAPMGDGRAVLTVAQINAYIKQIIDSNDPNNIIRQGSKKGLYEAFSLGVVWLEHELNKKD